MNLFEILSPACIRVPLAATEKKAAIDELVDMLAAAGKVTDPPVLKDAVWARETTRTTGIGHALAIPHGKALGVPNLCMAIGKPAQPIEFNAIDGKPVRLIVLLASPLDRTNDHIQALAKVSRLMASEEFRNRIYAADSAEQIMELLQRHETTTAVAAPAKR
ncbi:MAG: PTS sugar transporter subunit IIA [Planctomycetota bacterium]|nr:PTS sugar transporter subunit IIA [Planctomycetota bacterium]